MGQAVSGDVVNEGLLEAGMVVPVVKGSGASEKVEIGAAGRIGKR